MMAGLLIFGLAGGVPGKAPEVPRTPAALWGRVGVREPFLGSPEAQAEPQSLGRFLGMDDYARMRGNPSLGWFADQGFRWRGNRIAFLGVRAVTPDAAALPEAVWLKAFRRVAMQRGWWVDPKAPIRFKGACVGAVVAPVPGQPYPGVCLEVQVDGPTGSLLYRFSIAQTTAEAAVARALDWVLACAHDLESIQREGGGHAPTKP